MNMMSVKMNFVKRDKNTRARALARHPLNRQVEFAGLKHDWVSSTHEILNLGRILAINEISFKFEPNLDYFRLE